MVGEVVIGKQTNLETELCETGNKYSRSIALKPSAWLLLAECLIPTDGVSREHPFGSLWGRPTQILDITPQNAFLRLAEAKYISAVPDYYIGD
jgi:hypothetical protein